MEQLRNVAAAWRAGLGIGVVGLVSGLLLVFSSSGCGGVECGKGTVEVDGVCQVGKALVCGTGFVAKGATCEPLDGWIDLGGYCDPKTSKYDKALGKCVGTGGGPTGCTGTCQAPTTSGISLCGQVYEGLSLLKQWADPAAAKATPIGKLEGAYIRVYNPLDFVANPTTATPLAEGTIEDNGCFYIDDVTIPFAGFVALAVDDKVTSGTKWAFVATGETPVAGKNSVNLEIPALTEATVKLFGADLLKEGSMIMVFKDSSGQAVSGVTPVYDGDPYPWAVGAPSVKFFADDPATPPYFSTTATTTTKSGAVAVKKAPVKNFTGEKKGCTVEIGLGGSSPGTLFFRVFDVTGC